MDSFSAVYAARRSPPFSMILAYFTALTTCCTTTTQHNAFASSCFGSSRVSLFAAKSLHAAYHDDTASLAFFHNTKFSTDSDKYQHFGKFIIGSVGFQHLLFTGFYSILFQRQPRSPTPSPCTCTTSTSRPTRSSRGGAQRGRESVSTEPVSLQWPRFAIRIRNAHSKFKYLSCCISGAGRSETVNRCLPNRSRCNGLASQSGTRMERVQKFDVLSRWI